MKNGDFPIIVLHGKTTYQVNIFQSENAKKPLESVFRDLCAHEALDEFTLQNTILDESRKIS